MLKLKGVEETMLIPLVIKANETLRDNARIKDEKAVEIVKQLNIDTEKYDKFMSHEGVVARTILFDSAMKNYIEKYPDAVCISIGCGFDNRFERVDNGKIRWYDLDLPDVINARKSFFDERERVKLIGKSALDKSWTDEVEKGDTTIILIEGMLMYLYEEQIKELLNIIKDSFKNVIIIAELMPMAIRGTSKYHDTVKNTSATFKWGVKRAKDVEKLCSGLQLIEEKSFNCEMQKYSIRGKLFASIPFIKNLNNFMAIFRL